MTNTLFSRETLVKVLNDCHKHIDCSVRCDRVTYDMLQAMVKPYGQVLLKEKGLDYGTKVSYEGKVGFIVSAVTFAPFDMITFQYHTFKAYDGLEMIDEVIVLTEHDLDKVTLV